MPLEILIQYKNGEVELHYIPISLMRGEKENPYSLEWKIQPDWPWANLNYSFTIDKEKNQIEAIVIDPSNLMADIDKTDNFYVAPK
jgi:hypothetical protein